MIKVFTPECQNIPIGMREPVMSVLMEWFERLDDDEVENLPETALACVERNGTVEFYIMDFIDNQPSLHELPSVLQDAAHAIYKSNS